MGGARAACYSRGNSVERNLVHIYETERPALDCEIVGAGIGSAKRVADHARARGVAYVNHTFTSHLALSASLQPYAGLEDDVICEYPVEPKPLALEVTEEHLYPGPDGLVRLPEAPGLGVSPDLDWQAVDSRSRSCLGFAAGILVMEG